MAYHYPPIQSTGTERTTKFIRYLPEFGYHARVLTTSAFGHARQNGVIGAWEPLKLYRRLRATDVRGRQAPSFVRTDAGSLGGIVRLLRQKVLIPDAQMTWLPAALWRGLRALRTAPADILFSTFPPASAHLLALMLKRHTGTPWVADFRDSWTFDPLDPILHESRFRFRTEKRLEAAIVRGADLVVASTEISADYLRHAYPERAHAIVVVTNGFDPSDFPPAAAPAAAGPMRIVHTGSFTLSHPLRSPGTIFGALERLLQHDPAWAGQLQLELYGQLDAGEQKRATPLRNAGMVRLHGHCPRDQVLRAQQQADLLLLVDHQRSTPASNVPTKLYEYLAARRPILALCDAGMVAQLLRQTGAGIQVAPGDAAAAAAAVVEAHERRASGAGLPAPPGDLHRFHRRFLTRQLASQFDRVLAVRPASDPRTR